MTTLDYILQKFNLNPAQRSPIEIPNFGRDGLADLFHELDFKAGAEIGVERGEYSEVICRANPQAKLYFVDAWQCYQGYREHVSQEKLDGFYEFTQARLAPYDAKLIRRFSLDAVRFFEPNSLDFVYIDANHEYRQVVDDIAEWSRRVRPGGIVAGHDYARRKNPEYLCHVVEAVQGYTAAYHITWFVLGRKEAREGEVRDGPRSWMWVKTGSGGA